MLHRGGQCFPDLDTDGFEHNPEDGFSLFLQERCKRLYFIRHAEGYHNVAERETNLTPKSSILTEPVSGMQYPALETPQTIVAFGVLVGLPGDYEVMEATKPSQRNVHPLGI